MNPRVEALLADLWDELAPDGLTGELNISIHGVAGAPRKYDYSLRNVEMKGREIKPPPVRRLS